MIHKLVRHFMDPHVDAVQGRCVIRNSVEARLARSIAIDYFSGYIVNEYGRQALFELPAYGGANCAVRASTLRRLGGWNPDSVTEDTDLTMRILLSGGAVRYDIMAVDTEEGATTLRRFITQRYRWARGHQQAWRDYRKAVLFSRHLTWPDKFETLMFLLVYHVPVLCAMTLVTAFLRVAGIGPSITVFEMLPLAALLFAGPFCELAVGLLVGRAPRRAAVSMGLMTPLFFIFMLVCTRSWAEGVMGRPYTWAKTARSSWSALTPRATAPARRRTRDSATSRPSPTKLCPHDPPPRHRACCPDRQHCRGAGGFPAAQQPDAQPRGDRRPPGVLRARSSTTVVGDHTFQVLSPGHFPFRAVLTPYCSSLVSVLALGAIAIFVLRGPFLRRLSAFVVAGMFVLCCNVIRIGGSLWAGLKYGPSGLVLFHDWLGTMFGLLYTLFGFLLMLYLMLPSATADIAARCTYQRRALTS